jgi:ubiquinone/menaquinone biosynthesis C-methylase UbiE
MSLGRRKIKLADERAWVFNRMADVYDARPAYPPALIDALADLLAPGARVLDVGAGIGHLALPLAARGYAVTAVEPAIEMLTRLRQEQTRRGLTLETLHAQAEALPLADASAELAVIADALHFLDAERTGQQLSRVLVPHGALALITCDFADTPFMAALTQLMHEAAPRRPRVVSGALAQLSAVAGVSLTQLAIIEDDTPLDPPELERLLRTISFIGPAMNPPRFAAFTERVRSLPAPSWARRFTLRCGRRRQ